MESKKGVPLFGIFFSKFLRCYVLTLIINFILWRNKSYYVFKYYVILYYVIDYYVINYYVIDYYVIDYNVIDYNVMTKLFVDIKELIEIN